MGNIASRPDGKWRARYRDTSGRERTKQFARKVDAQRWLSETSQASLRADTSTRRRDESPSTTTRRSG